MKRITNAIINLMLISILFSSCKKETYKTTERVCVKSHFEEQEYETGGLMVSKSLLTTNRKEKRLIEICDSFRIDTIYKSRYIF